jgi:hypothetical protein
MTAKPKFQIGDKVSYRTFDEFCLWKDGEIVSIEYSIGSHIYYGVIFHDSLSYKEFAISTSERSLILVAPKQLEYDPKQQGDLDEDI